MDKLKTLMLALAFVFFGVIILLIAVATMIMMEEFDLGSILPSQQYFIAGCMSRSIDIVQSLLR